MKETVYTLQNGIRVALQASPGEVCCLGFALRIGTRDETDTEQGMAHFTEHMLFKGTHRRKAWQILDRMGRVGGEVNAYTTKEEIFLYAICLKQDYQRALDLMVDMLFHSTFPEREIDSEREVILDEINVYEDSPSDLIWDDFERIVYRDHPFGRNILGAPETLSKFRSEHFLAFRRRCLTSDRVVFFSVSSIDFALQRRWVERCLAEVPDTSSSSCIASRTAPVPLNGLRETIDRQTHQAHVLYGHVAYSLFDDKRMALFLLNNILGGPGMNSLLNNSLREKKGLVYTVESNYNAYSDTGLFSIYFGSDHADVEKCLHLIDKELRGLYSRPLNDYRLKAAKKQLFGQMAISAESKETQALGMGKSVLYFGTLEPLEETFRRIEALSAKQLQEVAEEIFSPATMSLLRYATR